MRIQDILTQQNIVPEVNAKDRDGVIEELAACLCAASNGLGLAPLKVAQLWLDRERISSTGIGEGIAIPHAKMEGLKNPIGCFGKSSQGVPFGSIDNKPVSLFFALLAPEDSANAHLKALALVSRLFKSTAFRNKLLALDNAAEIFVTFVEQEGRE